MAKTKPLSLNKDQQNEVTKALALIEDAQRKINMSAAMLCPIPGFGDEWAMSSGVYDHIKAYWHLVNDRKNRIALGLEKESVS